MAKEKKCTKCGRLLPLTSFHRRYDGCKSECKDCSKQRSIPRLEQLREVNKEKYQEKYKKAEDILELYRDHVNFFNNYYILFPALSRVAKMSDVRFQYFQENFYKTLEYRKRYIQSIESVVEDPSFYSREDYAFYKRKFLESVGNLKRILDGMRKKRER